MTENDHADQPQPSAPSPTLAPSDLVDLSPGPVRVGGRIHRSDGRQLLIADAFATVSVLLVEPPAAEVGDLAVVAGRLESAGIFKGRVLERYRPQRPPLQDGHAPSETTRWASPRRIAALRLRSELTRTVRRFFEQRGFIEVDTPSLVPSPGLDVHLDAFTVARARSAQYLSTSPEYQMKRLLSGGLPRIFQLTHCFRRDEVGALHNPEFTMLEWYRAFAGVDELIEETEQLVRHLVGQHAAGGELQISGRPINTRAPFIRQSVTEAFAQYAGMPKEQMLTIATKDEEQFFRVLVDQIEPALARLSQPVFLYDYPANFASLARLRPKAPDFCERFELYVGGVELCNGFGELTDPDEQRRRLLADRRRRAELGKPVYPLDERFLAALKEGMPPAAGNALGLDRLLALCAGTAKIADVQCFPHDWL